MRRGRGGEREREEGERERESMVEEGREGGRQGEGERG